MARHTNVLVSVAMAVRNGAAYVEAAIGSVLTQTHRELELIIVDDGSTDATPEILQLCARAEARVQVHHREPAGMSAALNHACALASGRYIARLDHDDLAVPTRLARQVAYLERHSDTGLLGGAVRFIRPDGRPSRVVHVPPTRDAAIRRILTNYNCFTHSGVLIRRDVFEATGGYRTAFTVGQDYDLWTRLAARARVANLKDEVVYYRLHLDQVSFDAVEQQAMANLVVSRASAQRAASGVDPLDSATRVDRQLAYALGVSDAEIDGRMFDVYVGRLALMRQLGLGADAVALVREPFQQRERLRDILRRVPVEETLVA